MRDFVGRRSGGTRTCGAATGAAAPPLAAANTCSISGEVSAFAMAAVGMAFSASANGIGVVGFLAPTK